MKRLLRITVLFSVTLLWWGEKGYAATPAMDAAEKETVSATVEAEADKKDPKSDRIKNPTSPNASGIWVI